MSRTLCEDFGHFAPMQVSLDGLLHIFNADEDHSLERCLIALANTTPLQL